MRLKLPFKFLSRSRWESIRTALDAWPRLVDHLEALLVEARRDADAAEKLAADLQSAARLLTMPREDGGTLIQAVVKY